jgi:hypothetical protein
MNWKYALATSSVILSFLACGSTSALAQPLVAKDVVSWVTHGPKNPKLDSHKGDLTLDDAAKKLSFASGKNSIDASYDGVRRIVLDAATHQRARLMMIAQIKDNIKRDPGDVWMYFESAAAGGTVEKHMLQIPRDSAQQVVDKVKQVFADRAVITDVRIGVLVDEKTLKDVGSKHTFTLADQKNHPAPELKPDQGLIVVLYPMFTSGGGALLLSKKEKHKPGEMLASQVKIHANDEVVLVNKVGTYGFAYLPPGDYQLAAQGAGREASVLQTKVEAGKAYYFTEDDFGSSPGYEIQLSQHSPELVMCKLGEAYFSIWTRKKK